MFPVLIELGPLALPTYGVLLAVAFLLALALGVRLARQEGIDAERITSLWVWFLLAGLIGAKLTLYMVDWRYYVENPAALLSTWRSAGVYYGGFLGAALAGYIFIRRHGLPLGRTVDVVAPSLALGQSVGRWGCLAAGCCYGTPTDVPWAITFTDPRTQRFTGAPLNVALHPSQVYLSLNALLLCALLLGLLWLRRRLGGPQGVVFWTYVLLYGASRFAIEFYRGDPRGQLGSLSTSQVMGLVAVATAAVALLVLVARWARSRT